MHRPSTFQDMLLLAEGADQAYMADRNGTLTGNTRQLCGGNLGNVSGGRGGYWGYGRGGSGNGGGRGQQVNWQNLSQFGNVGYKGPAPMVLGNVSGTTCHYCGKPGHFKRDCFKRQNDLAAGRAPSGGRGNGRNGGRGASRGNQRLNVIQEA